MILFVAVLLGSDVQAKLPGHLYFIPRTGLSFPGLVSEGSGFIGRGVAFSAAYVSDRDATVGLQASLGLELNAYRHYFDDDIFVEHQNRRISSDISARLKAGRKLHVLVGFNMCLSFYHEVDMGEKNFNNTYYYSTDSLRSRYKPSVMQAHVLVAMEYAIGKKEQSHLGIRVTQAGNSAVKENAAYNDASGNTVIISEKMRPMSAQLYISLCVSPRSKRSQKPIEPE